MALLSNVISQNINLPFSRLFASSTSFWNHYDILKVQRNSSAKEIKDSFIKLSKENHPDLNKNKDAHKTFLQISEAYKVLSNSQTRHMYDLGLAPGKSNSRTMYYHGQHQTDPWSDPIFYRNRDNTRDKNYDNTSYYGIKGVQKVSNFTIALLCLAVTAIGVGLQLLLISNSITFKRDELLRRSNEAENLLKIIKTAAEKNGNEKQLELIFKDKLKKE